MSLIYISNPQGQQTSYEEAEARRLWLVGAISHDSLYWREGMPQWRPAGEYFSASAAGAAATAPPPNAGHAGVRGFVRDPTRITGVLVGWLWAYLGAAAVTALSSLIGLATGLATQVDGDNLTTMDIINMCVGLPQTLIDLVTGVVFLMWIYRAGVNARGLGAQGMTFTPGWAVGYYFIPIMNLWKPYQAMKEIWQASENPASWPSVKPPTLLNVWWGLWLGNSLLGNASFRASFRASSATDLAISEVISILSDLVGIPLCLVAIRLVRGIVSRQSQWAAQEARSVCAVCGQPFAESDMIILNGAPVCAQCKPLMVQRMQEGLANP